MPITRSSNQKSKTLEEFYKELTSNNSTPVEIEIGNAMLSFLTMTNKTFVDTTLYGLTSHYALVIQATDKWDEDWYVRVDCIGDKKFLFEYQMTETKSPWKHAVVKGQANTIDEARRYLIIAMTESEGWKGNTELNKLYTDLKI